MSESLVELRLGLIVRIQAEVSSKHSSVQEILVSLVTLALTTNTDADAFPRLHEALNLHLSKLFVRILPKVGILVYHRSLIETPE